MRWRYYLLIVGSALALMGGNCTESGVVPCVEDADCLDTCTAECDRRGEELLSYVCGANTKCQCNCPKAKVVPLPGCLSTSIAGGGAGAGGGGGSV